MVKRKGAPQKGDYMDLANRKILVHDGNGKLSFKLRSELPEAFLADREEKRKVFHSIVRTLCFKSPTIMTGNEAAIPELKHALVARQEMYDDDTQGPLCERLKGISLMKETFGDMADVEDKRLWLVLQPNYVSSTTEYRQAQLTEFLLALWEAANGDLDCFVGLERFMEHNLYWNQNTALNAWCRLAAKKGPHHSKKELEKYNKQRQHTDYFQNPLGLDLEEYYYGVTKEKFGPLPARNDQRRTWEFKGTIKRAIWCRLIGSDKMIPVQDQLGYLTLCTGRYEHGKVDSETGEKKAIFGKACLKEPLRTKIIKTFALKNPPTLVPPPHMVFYEGLIHRASQRIVLPLTSDDQDVGVSATPLPKQKHHSIGMLEPTPRTSNSSLGIQPDLVELQSLSNSSSADSVDSPDDMYMSPNGYGRVSLSCGRISATEKGVIYALKQGAVANGKLGAHLKKNEWLSEQPIPTPEPQDQEEKLLCGMACGMDDFEILHAFDVKSTYKKVFLAHLKGDPKKICVLTAEFFSMDDFIDGGMRELLQQTEFSYDGINPIYTFFIAGDVWDDVSVETEFDKEPLCFVLVQPLAEYDFHTWIAKLHSTSDGDSVGNAKQLPDVFEVFSKSNPHLLKLALVINFLYEQGIIHRDLKPSNLFLGFSVQSGPGTTKNNPMLARLGDDGLISMVQGSALQVADFGTCRFRPDEKEGGTEAMTDNVGSLPYLPPRWLTKNLGNKARLCDVFAFGVTLYTFATNTLLDKSNTLSESDIFRWLNERFGKKKQSLSDHDELYLRIVARVCINAVLMDWSPAMVVEGVAIMCASLGKSTDVLEENLLKLSNVKTNGPAVDRLEEIEDLPESERRLEYNPDTLAIIYEENDGDETVGSYTVSTLEFDSDGEQADGEQGAEDEQTVGGVHSPKEAPTPLPKTTQAIPSFVETPAKEDHQDRELTKHSVSYKDTHSKNDEVDRSKAKIASLRAQLPVTQLHSQELIAERTVEKQQLETQVAELQTKVANSDSQLTELRRQVDRLRDVEVEKSLLEEEVKRLRDVDLKSKELEESEAKAKKELADSEAKAKKELDGTKAKAKKDLDGYKSKAKKALDDAKAKGQKELNDSIARAACVSRTLSCALTLSFVMTIWMVSVTGHQVFVDAAKQQFGAATDFALLKYEALEATWMYCLDEANGEWLRAVASCIGYFPGGIHKLFKDCCPVAVHALLESSFAELCILMKCLWDAFMRMVGKDVVEVE